MLSLHSIAQSFLYILKVIRIRPIYSNLDALLVRNCKQTLDASRIRNLLQLFFARFCK